MPSRLSILFLALICPLAVRAQDAPRETPDQIPAIPPENTPAPPPAEEAKAALIRQLGAESVEERDHAEQEIWKKGKVFLSLLQKAAESEDPEIAERASRIIPKIILSIKPNKSSILGDFADKYSVANSDDRSEMMGEFLERDELTAEEIKAALRMQVSLAASPEESRLNDWQLQKLGTLLYKESNKKVFNGDIDSAIELWSDIDFSPHIRHKYVSMLFNAGKPFDKSRFMEEDCRPAEAELALLAGDTEKARPLVPEGDLYLTQRIIAADFNLEEKWRLSLDSISTEHSTIQEKNRLPLLWASARSKGDKAGQEKAIAEIVRIEPRDESMSLDEIDFEEQPFNPDPIPYGKLEAANLLLSCGEVEKAARLVVESLPDASPDKTLNLIYSIVRFPGFDPTLLGAKEDTPEALVELASSICPLAAAPALIKNASPVSKENKMPSSAELTTMMKLLTVGNYMDARGEGARILPYILSHIQQAPDASRTLLAQYYVLILNAFDAQSLAYDIFQACVEANLIPEQSQEICELNLAYGNFRSQNTRKQWDSLYPLAAALTENPKNRQERLDTLIRLLGLLPDKRYGKDQNELLKKTQAYLKDHGKAEGMDTMAQTLVALLLKHQARVSDVLSIPEALGRPVLLSENDFPEEVCQLNRIVRKSGTKQLREQYRQAYQKKFDTLPQTEENDLEQLSEWGEYLSLLQEEKDPLLAEKTRKKARLYSSSETMSRKRNALSLCTILPADQLLNRAFPSYIVEADDAKNNSYAGQQLKMIQGSYLLFPCTRDGLHKQAWYFVEASLDELTASPLFNVIQISPIIIMRGMAELNRGLLEYKNGQKDKAMESFQLSRKLLRAEGATLLYSVLLRETPELKPLCIQWFQEDWKKKEALQKHWPNATHWHYEYILPGLLLDQNVEEVEKLFTSCPNHEEFSCLYQACLELVKGNRAKAREHLLEADREEEIGVTASFLLALLDSGYDPKATIPPVPQNEPGQEQPAPQNASNPPTPAPATAS